MLSTRCPWSRRSLSKLPLCLARFESTAATPPPLLLKLRRDLKTAMQNKDSNRLAVLRGLLSDITNASKTSTPVQKDVQILALLRKREAASKAAAEEFKAANREDLKEKEDAQISVLEEYVGGVEVLSKGEVDSTVKSTVEKLKTSGQAINKGVLMRALVGPGGVFDGKNVEKQQVASSVDAALAS